MAYNTQQAPPKQANRKRHVRSKRTPVRKAQQMGPVGYTTPILPSYVNGAITSGTAGY